ncbi:MAG: OsmC family protein [Bdellovibrionota bacterium]
MVKMKIDYQGQKHCELTHLPSGSKIETDAPKDNGGKGERFSPTDLLGASLASCILTTMHIVCEREGWSFEGGSAEVGKVMTDQPRRVDSLSVTINLPKSLTTEQRKKLEHVAEHCPVHRSLHPDVKMPMTFNYV